MSNQSLPLIIETDKLEAHLNDNNLLIVDLSRAETYNQYHVPGAVYLDYAKIVRVDKPVMGLIPDDRTLSEVFSSIGMDNNTHVVAYDDEGGGKASRFLWTLDVAGHANHSLLNGGLHAWANEGHTLIRQPTFPNPKQFQLDHDDAPVADKQYILSQLDNPDVMLIDARSMEEYKGIKNIAARGGHIPDAINIDWVQTMDKLKNLRFLPDTQLKEMLNQHGISADKEVIVYCQTHHRSSHTYIMLKHLGYQTVKGYPGAWSDWGNDPSTPIEV